MAQENQAKRRRTGWIIALGVIVVGGVALLAGALTARLNDIFANIEMMDCGWSATAHAWIDADGDGVRADDERPLAGVQLHVDDVSNDIRRVASGVTDADGKSELSVFIAGCPETKMEVYAEAPTGYCLTTPGRMDAGPYAFGFAAC